MQPDIWGDFNSIQDESALVALLRFASDPSKIRPRAAVMVGDHDGNRCLGVVMDVDGELVRLRLDLATFEAASAHGLAATA